VRALQRLLVVVVALLGFSGCSAGYGVDRGDYVAANEAILAELPWLDANRGGLDPVSQD
jgi:hypothetical protein